MLVADFETSGMSFFSAPLEFGPNKVDVCKEVFVGGRKCFSVPSFTVERTVLGVQDEALYSRMIFV